MSSSCQMPTGWRFCPEDHELIRDYLYNKVIQQQLPFEGLIAECDLYGNKNPWEIWGCFSEYVVKSDHYEDLYVFTKLKRKNAEAKNVERKVGLGSWEGEAIAKEIIINNSNTMNQSVVIGFMKRFRFEKSGTHQDGKWIMHEYSLHPSLFPSNYLHMKDYVVCRIRQNYRNIKLQKRRKESEENQQKYHEEQKDHNQTNKKIRTETKENSESRICREKKDNQRIPPAKSMEEETNISVDDFSSWLEANLSSDDDPEGEKKGNSSPTNLSDDKYFNLSISNTLDNVELFVEKDPKSDDFFSWADKFFSVVS